jgi:hypothetical protein
MENIQLFALKQGGSGPADYLQLDLYKEEPIKITRSIEDIQSPQTTASAFSRTFRIPATSTNGEFMRAVFNVNSVDYDATQKAMAYINMDGSYFMSGNIRLQNIIKNSSRGKIEYEIIFMGETSTFASVVGPKNLSEVDLTDPVSGQTLIHDRNYANIRASWNKQLFNGVILYPLVEWGYTYDSSTKVPQQHTLSVYNATTSIKGFTRSDHPLSQSQFKPYLQAKYLWDRIFDGAGFSYTSTFLNSQLFKNLYTVMTTPDTSGPTLSSTINFKAALNPNQGPLTATGFPGTLPDPIKANFVYLDNSNSYSTAGIGKFIAPFNGNYSFTLSDVFLNYSASGSASGPLPFVISIQPEGGTKILHTAYVNNNGADFGKVYFNSGLTNTAFTFVNVPMIKGQGLLLFVEDRRGINGTVTITKGNYSGELPNKIDPKGLLSSQYKQLEFIKSINDRFKLMWEPDPQNPKKFIIEPWKDWIKTGKKKDWTNKINEAMDEVITPAFYTQPRQWDFKDAEETDLYNFSYQQENKETFGQLDQNSNIEIISGTKEFTSLFAAYPLAPIPGNDLFLIPHLAKDTEAQRQPIQVKPRLCFYNSGDLISAPVTWYMQDDGPINTAPSRAQTQYPITSTFDRFPFDANAFDLSWTNVKQFWTENTTTGAGRTNITGFTTYWETWFNSIFNPYSRIMTATFALTVNDFRDLMFNDKIFIRDSWWYPLKIYDFVLGEKQNVKVDLLKIGSIGVSLEDFQPEPLYEHPLLCYSFDALDGCTACCCDNPVRTTVWTRTPTFAGATLYFSDPGGSVLAQPGWYNDGNITLYINSDGLAISAWDCTQCSCTQSGLTEQTTCYGPTQCEACCCLTGTATIYTDGLTLGTSRRAWANASGTIPLTPFTWYAKSGEVFLMDADGTTVLLTGICDGCDCTPLEQQAPLPGFYLLDNGYEACCIQGPSGSIGINTYWSTQQTFQPAPDFYTQNSTSFPLGAGLTGPIWLSDGQFYKSVVNGVTTSTTPCPPFPCPNRTNPVEFNLVNISGVSSSVNAEYDISFDGSNFYYAGATGASGPGFNIQSTVLYDPTSLIQAKLDIPTVGNLSVVITFNTVTILQDFIPTPTTYITPPFVAGTGSYEYFFTLTP